jgi:hypothetical protein
MAKFRKRPVVIDAIKFTGVNPTRMAVYNEFVGRPLQVRDVDGILHLVIPTLEGDHLARPGDMIIKGVKGEFYPCKPDIFAATYEAAE